MRVMFKRLIHWISLICCLTLSVSFHAIQATELSEQDVQEIAKQEIAKKGIMEREDILKQTYEFTKILVDRDRTLVFSFVGFIILMVGYQFLNAEKLKSQFKETLDQTTRDAKDSLNYLVRFHQDQYILARRIEDIEEPSLRHLLTDESKAMIWQYVTELEQMKKKIPEINLTSFDCEITGDAYHYLAGIDTQGDKKKEKMKEDCEEKAIKYYMFAIKEKAHPSILRTQPGRGKSVNQLVQKLIFWQTQDRGREEVNEEVNVENYKLKRKLANAYAGIGNYEKAIQQYQDVKDKLPEIDPLIYISWGDALKGQEDFEGAVKQYSTAIEIMDKHTDKKRFCKDYIECHYQKGNVLTALGRYDEAIEFLDKARKLAEKENLILKWVNQSLADAYRKNCNYESSIKYYELEKIQHPDNGETYFREGQAHDMQATELSFQKVHLDYFKPEENDHLTVQAYYQKAEECYLRACKNYKTPVFLAYFGYALKELGDESLGSEYLKEAISIQKQKLNDKKNRTAQGYYDLAVCYAMDKNTQDALEWLKKACDKSPYPSVWAQESKCLDFKGIFVCDAQRDLLIKVLKHPHSEWPTDNDFQKKKI